MNDTNITRTWLIREAEVNDIPEIQLVRNAVKENRLSDPALVPDSDVEEYITRRGKGWVALIGDRVVGFAIADLLQNNIWALFVHPDQEARGIGKQLHDRMLDWYFSQTSTTVWLGTAPDSRAEKFYRMQGWAAAGMHGKAELKFEMDRETWFRSHQQ